MAGQVPDDNKSVDYNTPQWVVDATKEVFQGEIALDPCSNPSSLVDAKHKIMLPTNGLEESWVVEGGVFINPPFGRCYLHRKTGVLLDPKEWKNVPKSERDQYFVSSIEDWQAKAADTFEEHGVPFIMLVPAYMNAQYLHEQVLARASAICFPKGRFTFENAANQAAFHVCLPLYGNDTLVERFTTEFTKRGHSVVALRK